MGIKVLDPLNISVTILVLFLHTWIRIVPVWVQVCVKSWTRPSAPPRVSRPGLDSPVLSGYWASVSARISSGTSAMGVRGSDWFFWATFLGLAAWVQCVTRADFFPFGESAGDQVLEPGSDQTHRLGLDQPLLFYDGTFDHIYVSDSTEPSRVVLMVKTPGL